LVIVIGKLTIHAKGLEFMPYPLSISVSEDPITTGYSLPVQMSDIHKTITISVPPEDREAVTSMEFGIAGVARATFDVVDINTEVGTVTLDIYGVSATPAEKPEGDTTLEIKVSGVLQKTIKIIVKIPKVQIHIVGQTVVGNSARIFPGMGTELKTIVGCIVRIHIKDQFGQLLESIYNGEGVVDEGFVNQRQTPPELSPLPNPWQKMVLPDARFILGEKKDVVRFNAFYGTQQILTAKEQADWAKFMYNFMGKYQNAFAIVGGENNIPKYEKEGDMQLRVWGHELPTVNRKMSITNKNNFTFDVTN